MAGGAGEVQESLTEGEKQLILITDGVGRNEEGRENVHRQQ